MLRFSIRHPTTLEKELGFCCFRHPIRPPPGPLRLRRVKDPLPPPPSLAKSADSPFDRYREANRPRASLIGDPKVSSYHSIKVCFRAQAMHMRLPALVFDGANVIRDSLFLWQSHTPPPASLIESISCSSCSALNAFCKRCKTALFRSDSRPRSKSRKR